MKPGTLRKAHAALETGLALASSAILFLLMLYVTAEVAARYLFGRPLRGHLETTQLLIAPAALLALAWLQAQRGHVGMDLIYARLSRRARAAADCVALTLALATFAMLAWFSADATWLAWDIGDATPTANVPTWWSKAAVPLGAWAAVICRTQAVDRLLTRCVRPTRLWKPRGALNAQNASRCLLRPVVRVEFGHLAALTLPTWCPCAADSAPCTRA